MDCRKSVRDLTEQERRDFVTAVRRLKDSDEYETFVKQHVETSYEQQNGSWSFKGFPNDAHGGPAFLPWHRKFIREFEKKLQEKVPGVTLPYWDWTEDRAQADDVRGPTELPVFNGTASDPTDGLLGGDGTLSGDSDVPDANESVGPVEGGLDSANRYDWTLDYDMTRGQPLIEEFDSHDIPYVIVEPDPDRAVRLHEAGRAVIRADPESTEGLTAANLVDARALVTDVSDQVDASIVLAAKELSPGVRVISVVEDPDRERYHRLAGADEVLSPRSLLGESLAAKVTTALQTDLGEAVDIGDSLQLAEVSVPHGSPLAGLTLADSDIGERAGVNVIGAWFNGEFDAAPPPDATLSAGTVLLVSGQSDQLGRLVDMTNTATRRFGAGETVVIGYGQVGRTVAEVLADADLPVTVVDRDDAEGVDVVGDATDPETLRAAGVEAAQTVVLALPDDTTTEFTTLVVRDLSPNTQVLARVEEAASVRKMHRAGADYVLSLATVTGRLSASTVIEDRDVLSLNQQIEVVRSRVSRLAGKTIGRADVREATGCTIIAIERGDETVTEIGPDTRIEPDDELVVVGTDEGIREFERRFV